MQAGIILTGYELLKTSIVDEVRNFFTMCGETSPKYASDVLGLVPGNRLQSSVAWLESMNALGPEHTSALHKIRETRNSVAHELTNLLIDVDTDIDVTVIADIRNVMRALDRFWIGIAIDCDPDLNGLEANLDDCRTGSGVLLDHLLGLATETEGNLRT